MPSPEPESKIKEKKLSGPQCPYCGSTRGLVWVHGHGQCRQCGINIDECCRGEQCRIKYGHKIPS